MPKLIQTNDQIIQDLMTNGYAIGKLDGSANQELLHAKEQLIEEIKRPPVSTPVNGYSTIQHMPATCLDIQILPCIADIFRGFYKTRNVVFTFDVPQHVQHDDVQTYRGLGRQNHSLVALIILNKQRISPWDTEVDIGNVVFWKVCRLNKYFFPCNNSSSDWLGLFTGFWPEMDDCYGVEMRQWMFETGQFGLFHDRVVKDGRRKQEVADSRVQLKKDQKLMSTLIGTNDTIPLEEAKGFHFFKEQLLYLPVRQMSGKQTVNHDRNGRQKLHRGSERTEESENQFFPSLVKADNNKQKKIQRRPRAGLSSSTKERQSLTSRKTKASAPRPALTELTRNEDTENPKFNPGILKSPSHRQTANTVGGKRKRIQFKEKVDISFFHDKKRENTEQPPRSMAALSEVPCMKKKRNRKNIASSQKHVKTADSKEEVSSPSVCPSMNLNAIAQDINHEVSPSKLLKNSEMENQINLMHTAMIEMIQKEEPREPSFMDVVTNIGRTNCLEYPRTDCQMAIDLTIDDNDISDGKYISSLVAADMKRGQVEDICMLSDSSDDQLRETAMTTDDNDVICIDDDDDIQEVTEANYLSALVKRDVNPLASCEIDPRINVGNHTQRKYLSPLEESNLTQRLLEDLEISSDSDDDENIYMPRKPVYNAMHDDQMNRLVEHLHKGSNYSSDEESSDGTTVERRLIDKRENVNAPFRTVSYKNHHDNVLYCKSSIHVPALSVHVLYISTPNALEDFLGKCWNDANIFRTYFSIGNDVSTKFEIRGENARSPTECLKAFHALFCNKRGFLLKKEMHKRPCGSSFSLNEDATELQENHVYRVNRHPGRSGVCCPICHPVVSIKAAIATDRGERYDKLMDTEYRDRVLSLAKDLDTLSEGKENKERYQRALQQVSDISKRISTTCKNMPTPIHLTVLTPSQILDSHKKTATMIKDAIDRYVDNQEISEKDLGMDIKTILHETEEMQKIQMMKNDKFFKYLYDVIREPHEFFLRVLLFKHSDFKDVFSDLECSIE